METEQDNSNQQSEVQVPVQTERSLDLRNTDIDFMTIVEPGGDPVKGLYLSIIQDAMNDYLWFGLKSKYAPIDIEDFLHAYNYLFITKSTEESTWFSSSIPEDEGTPEVELQPDQIKLMCFDAHFDFTKLGNRIKFPILLEFLKSKRIELVESHYPRLLRKINSSKKKYYRSKGQNYKTINLNKNLVTKCLVTPTEDELISLYFGDINETTV